MVILYNPNHEQITKEYAAVVDSVADIPNQQIGIDEFLRCKMNMLKCEELGVPYYLVTSINKLKPWYIRVKEWLGFRSFESQKEWVEWTLQYAAMAFNGVTVVASKAEAEARIGD